MRTSLWAFAGILLFGLAGADSAGGDKPAKKRLLVITESKGYRHGCVARKTTIVVNGKALSNKDTFEMTVKGRKMTATLNGRDLADDEITFKTELSLVEKTFQEMANKHGFFEVVCSQDARRDITDENLKNFDAVWFYTTGELPISDVQKADLLAFVRSGKGFGGSHSATDTFYKWKEYGELIGAYFDGHPWHTKINVIVEDKKHPATRHLGDAFEITDEIYQFRGPYSRDKLHILMKLDMGNLKPGNRKDGDNALAWTHEFGKGRVFYTALGHRDEVWRDPRYQQHVLGALRFLFGLEKADATPSKKEE